METLNNIEKITLLVSTSIVCLANLFVMIEKTKKSEKHTLNTIIQKLFGFKKSFFVFCLIVVMSSCSGHKFLNRKYTSGRFVEHKKSLTHNTIYADTTKHYSSSNNQLELKKTSTISTSIFDKEIINNKVESIIKKDSIFIIKKKGKDKVLVVKNSLPDVTVVVYKNTITEKPKKIINYTEIQAKKKAKIVKFSRLCLYISFVPFLGFVFSITTKRLIKKYNKQYPNESKTFDNSRINIAMVLSIFFSLVGLVFLLYGFFLLFLANSMTAIY